MLSIALLVLAGALWKYLWAPQGITMNETIAAFLGAMSATGAGIGTLVKRGVVGAFVGLGLAIAWCLFLATLVLTGIQGVLNHVLAQTNNPAGRAGGCKRFGS
jgi:hypothetical protein